MYTHVHPFLQYKSGMHGGFILHGRVIMMIPLLTDNYLLFVLRVMKEYG